MNFPKLLMSIALAPIVMVQITHAQSGTDHSVARLGVRAPIGRLGELEDLAGFLLFLCSRASHFDTGHIINADGGYTAVEL